MNFEISPFQNFRSI